nr:HupE/UreJ family protein [Chthoniobacterales bacterium]
MQVLLKRSAFLLLGALLLAGRLAAHDLPLSYVDLRITNDGIDATIESSAKNFARELPGVEEGMLLDPAGVLREKERLLANVASSLTINCDGEMLPLELRGIEALPARRDLRLQLRFHGKSPASAMEVRCALFASDPRHRTFLNIYQGDALKYQGIFDSSTAEINYVASARQNALTVVRQFLWEGIHHIFIGPDHILFIVGLLLLGGTLGQLLKIVTAFTISHSITLVLATLNILSPPARVIEPAIALSIVFVGAHALLQGNERCDWRLLFAFGFGFIHGFGFANVLREMQLPRAALGWSLFSFNAGVEVGQACIVLAVAPALGILIRRDTQVLRALITAASFGVVFA